MAEYNEKELISSIRSSNFASVYFLYGPDEYSKEICVKRLIKEICVGGVSPSLFDGQALDMQKLHEECNSVSFFTEKKCVIIRNPSVDSFTASQAETFYEILKSKPDSTTVIVISKHQEIKPKSSPKYSKFITFISKHGVVVNCEEKSQNDVINMITNIAKKSGCSIEPAVAATLAEKCLNDMLIIDSELVKLCAFSAEKNGGVITADAVENLSAKQLDYKAYEITRHIISKDVKKAIKILDSLFLQQTDEIVICAAISTAFTDIYRVKMMQEYSHSVNELSAVFNYKGKEYKLRSAGYDAAKCSLSYLKNAIVILADTDKKLKSTKDDKKILLELALNNIINYDTFKTGYNS